jgi:hypothetical protein
LPLSILSELPQATALCIRSKVTRDLLKPLVKPVVEFAQGLFPPTAGDTRNRQGQEGGKGAGGRSESERTGHVMSGQEAGTRSSNASGFAASEQTPR